MTTHKQNTALTVDRTIWAWLTPERRKALYGATAAVLTLLAAMGIITSEQAQGWGEVAQQLITAAVMILAVVHTGGVYEAPVQHPDTEGGAPGAGPDVGGGETE